jgi:hypothetical protein
MSHQLISHSPDLKKLQDQGYEVSIIAGTYLLVSSVPYLSPTGEVKVGTLVSKLELAGDRTVNPVQDHVVYFIGEHPHNADGGIVTAIQHSTQGQLLHEGLQINHTFSNKFPDRLYGDYFEKITRYINIISSQAEAVDSKFTAKTFKPIESPDPEIVFHYYDTNSSRAEINIMSSRFAGQKIAIVGLGGTGSYILDHVAKTPVSEIHLYDEDVFLQHNAFRSPGAADIEKLKEKPKKVQYFTEMYSRMHKYITPHDFNISKATIEELSSMSFVFICIDKGEAKKEIMEYLTSKKIPFVDTGIGVEIVDDKLRGSVRQTLFTEGDSQYLYNWISLFDEGNDEYAQNIQISDLNSLNACLAVIKWKKVFGFYHDTIKEYTSSYDIDVNSLFNNEIRS